MLAAVADAQADLAQVHLDSSHVRSHVSAVGAAGGSAVQSPALEHFEYRWVIPLLLGPLLWYLHGGTLSYTNWGMSRGL